jgi:hypothetical protein
VGSDPPPRDGRIPGTGRLYTIEVEGSDAAGNTIRQSVTVRVPIKRS